MADYKELLRELVKTKCRDEFGMLDIMKYNFEIMDTNMKLQTDIRFNGLPQDKQKAFVEYATDVLNDKTVWIGGNRFEEVDGKLKLKR
jgi:hypothetical protein